VVSLVVAVSMVAHTLTATTGMRWYARRTGSEVPEGEGSTLGRTTALIGTDGRISRP
jgi:hypothetical protein